MRTITVTGLGAARVVPDFAVVRVAAAHSAGGVTEALAGVSSAVESLGEVARRFTDEAHISTQGLSVWPSHDYEGLPSGFEARHSLAVGCPGVAQAGELVAALAAEVGNRLQVESVGLEVADRAGAESSAREAAWADARARAGHLAALAGSEVGDVQAVTEGGPHVASGPAATGAFLSKMEVALEPGESEVRAALTVTFQLL